MGIKGVYFIFIILSVYIMQYTDAFPRDSNVVKTETLELNGVSSSTVKASPAVVNESASKFPAGRVNCSYEEATEDAVCQEHCLPKGYSYGICVSKTCTCI